MAFVVENGSGLSNANSFASVAFADEYHADRGDTIWAGLSQAQKQSLLIRATDYINNTFGNAFLGQAAFYSQALAWPRYIGSNLQVTPLTVMQAACYMALKIHAGALDAPPGAEREKRRVKVGPIEIEYAPDSQGGMPFDVAPFLKHWLGGVAATPYAVRLVRA